MAAELYGGAWADEASWHRRRHPDGCVVCASGHPFGIIGELDHTWVTTDPEVAVDGYVCVISKTHAIEPFELPEAERVAFWTEAMLVAERLNQLIRPVKMNYEIHGNTLPHLHMHLIPRQAHDPFVGRPVNLKETHHRYTDTELDQLRRLFPPPGPAQTPSPPASAATTEPGAATTTPERYTSIVDVYVLLQRADDRILLLERANTGYADGQLCPPSGHLEANESVIDGAIREAHEEVGVVIRPNDITCVHVVHHRSPQGQGRIGIFFRTTQWSGEPTNCEPHKCAGLYWVNPDDLPANTVPYSAAAITQIQTGAHFSIDGWT